VTRVSAIVVTHRGGPLLDACLRALRIALDRLGEPSELVVVDNAWGGEPPADVGARVLRETENRGFAGGVVRGLAACDGDWALLVNDDAELEPDALGPLLAAARSARDVGAATGQVRFHARRDVINSAGMELDRLGIPYDRLAGAPATDGGPVQEVFGASACVVIYRRAMLDAIGGFDPSFFAYYEDADVAWRARMAGWRSLYVPAAVAYHHGSATAGEASARKYFLVGRNRMRLLARHATTGQLVRWGWAMLLYDVAYVVFVALSDRTLAPLRGRVAGLREWRRQRRVGAGRRPVALAAPTGPLGAWRQRAAYRRGAG
jgi:GT2 family glycosyltransferase